MERAAGPRPHPEADGRQVSVARDAGRRRRVRVERRGAEVVWNRDAVGPGGEEGRVGVLRLAAGLHPAAPGAQGARPQGPRRDRPDSLRPRRREAWRHGRRRARGDPGARRRPGRRRLRLDHHVDESRQRRGPRRLRLRRHPAPALQPLPVRRPPLAPARQARRLRARPLRHVHVRSRPSPGPPARGHQGALGQAGRIRLRGHARRPRRRAQRPVPRAPLLRRQPSLQVPRRRDRREYIPASRHDPLLRRRPLGQSRELPIHPGTIPVWPGPPPPSHRQTSAIVIIVITIIIVGRWRKLSPSTLAPRRRGNTPLLPAAHIIGISQESALADAIEARSTER
mmetsp:Transcript_8260/g.25585  ORF Transcript_8260/g.25585 Transcript_8260/m.25585 type:complete len:340 (+) Transcript_8260:324-1343(+)